MTQAIPPPPQVPDLTGRSNPPGRVWFYAGPILLDLCAIVCTTVLVAIGKLEVENFKYLIGVLVVGNLALRAPGIGPKVPPSGGGMIVAVGSSLLASFKGFKS